MTNSQVPWNPELNLGTVYLTGDDAPNPWCE
jgi:hypothetical protein